MASSCSQPASSKTNVRVVPFLHPTNREFKKKRDLQNLQLFLGERRVVNVWLTRCPCHHRTTNTICITSVLRDTTPQLGVEERAMTLKLPTIYDPKNGMSLKPLNSLLCYRVTGLKNSSFILGSEVTSAYY